ncbi:ESX secretion-associated protein EspG [Mycobacterium sp.]|uniref:ESX secretion-associated protein EspG n=1 Tax=Mycobacterium sp. TaxID=1785 RepID=UPI0031E1F6C3
MAAIGVQRDMLTTTVDGLWVLQVLTGTEVVATELGLRPHLPRAEPRRLALAHPVMSELRANGVVGESDDVAPAAAEWLAVLSRRDIGLLVTVRTPADALRRVLLARFAHWWVALERAAERVAIRGSGTAGTEGEAQALILTEVERLCGVEPPAPLKPVTLDGAALRAEATSLDAVRRHVAGQGLDADQRHLLALAADAGTCRQVSIVAAQCGVDTGRPTRAHVEPGAVTVIDTPSGRLVAEHLRFAGGTWIVVSPGTASSIGAAVRHMMRRLPAQQEWYCHRKAV